MKFSLKEDAGRVLVICIASLIMAANIKTFVRTGDLFPGGVTGLTILIQRAAEQMFEFTLPYTVVNLLLNAVPVYIGLRYIGKKFTLYSCLSIILTAVFTDLIPEHVITYDVLLISVFGGMITGFSIGLCLLVDATSGGTDFIAIFLSEKRGVDAWNLILVFNIMVLAVAGVLFGWDKALYSIIFQYACTQTLHILYKKYQQQTLFVVTDHPRAVCQAIYKISHHGATMLIGEGAFAHCERNVVYSVVSSAESKKVIRAVKQEDPGAFINTIRTAQLFGRFYQRPNE